MIKLFKPEVQLVRTPTDTGKGIFHLHAITYTDNTSYEATGFTVADQLDSDGMLMIALLINKTPKALAFNYLHPVTHTITIGELPFEDDFGILNVLVIDESVGSRNTEPRGGSQIGSADSDEDDRPIGG